MIQVFNEPPQGLQVAPHEPRILAAGHQIGVREIKFGEVHDKDGLMLALGAGLALPGAFGRNWDALYDVLTDPDRTPPRLALLLCDYADFRRRHPHLSQELEATLLDAQRSAAEQGRDLWLLLEEPDSDPKAW
ncbi:barstar family protein [Deinococcus multiflagellatus]|uniref:Barstar family protein n=1 Tax=Deinococcus multiflagellatus TaxID=1656887 RepID=A0ABW1ZK16_9DEIO|nr:barstar family protein [Deinococcus multiflagellatus]MBZ9713713.1 barstar family protein [Deinococcus multiflagellatus]